MVCAMAEEAKAETVLLNLKHNAEEQVMENVNKIVCSYCDSIRNHVLISSSGNYICVFCADEQRKGIEIFANLFGGNITVTS